MSIAWSDFDQFKGIEDKYLPVFGQGETMATQIVTAVCKLVYKWFNDGDVYDNTHYLEGWANDLSDYANWLNENIDNRIVRDILFAGAYAKTDDKYEEHLYSLCEMVMNEGFLQEYAGKAAVGSIYDCSGEYSYRDYSYNSEEEDW